jgi:phage-related protein
MAKEITVRVTGEDDFSQNIEKGVSRAEGAFDKLGETGGNAEQKFIGLSDSITGTQDVMAGLASGNIQQVAMGMADLAGAAEALWSSFGKVIVQLGKKIAAQAADIASTIANTAATVAHTVATGAAAAASAVWTAAQWLLNAALAANPIGLVVLAIAGLVAAFILAWKHSETFRDIVTGAFNAVWSAIKFVFDWVKDHWPLLLGILLGPVGLAVGLIIDNFGTIKNAATGVYQWIVDRFTDLLGFFTGLPDRIKGAFGDALSMLYDIGKQIMDGLWNGLKDKWGDVSGWVGGIGDKIKGLKGPIETDRQLLVPEGEAVMDGFQTGLRNGWGGVASFLGSVAAKAAAAASTAAAYPVIRNVGELAALRATGARIHEDMFAPGVLAQGGYGNGQPRRVSPGPLRAPDGEG